MYELMRGVMDGTVWYALSAIPYSVALILFTIGCLSDESKGAYFFFCIACIALGVYFCYLPQQIKEQKKEEMKNHPSRVAARNAYKYAPTKYLYEIKDSIFSAALNEMGSPYQASGLQDVMQRRLMEKNNVFNIKSMSILEEILKKCLIEDIRPEVIDSILKDAITSYLDNHNIEKQADLINKLYAPINNATNCFTKEYYVIVNDSQNSNLYATNFLDNKYKDKSTSGLGFGLITNSASHALLYQAMDAHAHKKQAQLNAAKRNVSIINTIDENVDKISREIHYLYSQTYRRNIETAMDQICDVLYEFIQEGIVDEKKESLAGDEYELGVLNYSENSLETEGENKQRKNFKLIELSLGCLAVLVLIGSTVLTPMFTYNKAVKLLENKEFNEAIATFEELNGYRDSETLILQCKKENAEQYIIDKNYDRAIRLLEEIKGYSDSDILMLQAKYEKAQLKLKEENYYSAYELFGEAKGYKDAEECQKESYYMIGKDSYGQEDYENAKTIFEVLGNYKDSEKFVVESQNGIIYNEAMELLSHSISEGLDKLLTIPEDYKNVKAIIEIINLIQPLEGTYLGIYNDFGVGVKVNFIVEDNLFKVSLRDARYYKYLTDIYDATDSCVTFTDYSLMRDQNNVFYIDSGFCGTHYTSCQWRFENGKINIYDKDEEKTITVLKKK